MTDQIETTNPTANDELAGALIEIEDAIEALERARTVIRGHIAA